mgnify:CR=1 FL=1
MSLFKQLNKTNIASKPIIENVSIQRLIPKCKEWKTDTLFITTKNSCSYCKEYNRKIYSLYGWNKKYPILPELLLKQKCPKCNGSIGATMHFK